MLERKVESISKLFGIIGMVIVVPMMLLTVVDVLLRTIFNCPILGAHEVGGFMLVILVFLTLAYTLFQKGHTAIDLLTERLPEKVRAVMVTAGYLFSTFIFVLITWQTTIYALEKLHQGVRVATIPLQIYPFVFITAFGCALMSLALLVHFLYSFSDWRSK